MLLLLMCVSVAARTLPAGQRVEHRPPRSPCLLAAPGLPCPAHPPRSPTPPHLAHPPPLALSLARPSNHGKRDRWGKSGVHYHEGMQAGENTLNAQCSRLVLRGMAKRRGYDPASFLQD